MDNGPGFRLVLNKKFDAKLRRYLRARMLKIASMLTRYIQRSFGNNRTGKTPSRPGQPPAVHTGTLKSSIQSRPISDKFTEGTVVGVLNGPATTYAKILEFSPNPKMRRPFLRPALEKNRRKIVRLLTK